MADKTIFGFTNDIPSYEDESLVDMDPSLTGFDDGDEDIDLLNDDTFGSGAVVDDWEEAHRKLAGLDIKGVNHSKYRAPDDNLDVEEEILEKNLTRLVEEDDSEPKKPYASSGYKDIPTAANISSVWNGSPLSSPTSSDSLHDLINPSTNIWASPERLSTKPESTTVPTKPPPGFPPRDKPYRRPFSPAFEDDAIVTAVPKTETLLPPSSFAKKIPSNAIRLEDLEKELGEPRARPINQIPKDPLMGVRAPPGLPNPLMRTPMMRTPNVPRTPHNTPLPTPHQSPYQTPQHIFHGHNSPRPGMPFPRSLPRTPQMAPIRHMYGKAPLSAGTPPHLQRLPMGYMHSDPAHLMHPYHNVPPPRPRFSTPQGYPPNMRYPNNRHHDNSHSRDNSHQQSDLERKIHSILNDETVNNTDEYAGLMTRREKEWIIKIQLLQLTSNNPDMDDFYFQTYIRRKRARERAKQGEGVENLSTRGRQPAKMTLPDFERQDREYKPMAFKDTLGKLSASHVAHPREMVQVPQIHKDSDQDKQGTGSAVKESRRRRLMLCTIEKSFDILLELDDIESQQLQASPEERSGLLEKKKTILTKLSHLLKLNSDYDATTRTEFLSQLMSHRKGKVLISRLLQVLDQSEGENLLASICQNMVSVIKKDHQDEVLPLLIGPLSRVIEITSMETTLQSFKSIVHGSNEPLSFVLGKQFGVSVLCCLLKRAAALKIEIDQNEDEKKSWESLVRHVTKQFNDVPVKLLAKNLTGVTPLVTVLGSCASPSDMNNLQQHYRLALSTREEMAS